MMEKVYIEIDASPWLDAEGNIEISVYLGEDACEPCYEQKVSLVDLIDKELYAYTVLYESPVIANHHFEDVESLLRNLKNAYEYAEKRAKEMGYDDAERKA